MKRKASVNWEQQTWVAHQELLCPMVHAGDCKTVTDRVEWNITYIYIIYSKWYIYIYTPRYWKSLNAFGFAENLSLGQCYKSHSANLPIRWIGACSMTTACPVSLLNPLHPMSCRFPIEHLRTVVLQRYLTSASRESSGRLGMAPYIGIIGIYIYIGYIYIYDIWYIYIWYIYIYDIYIYDIYIYMKLYIYIDIVIDIYRYLHMDIRRHENHWDLCG